MNAGPVLCAAAIWSVILASPAATPPPWGDPGPRVAPDGVIVEGTSVTTRDDEVILGLPGAPTTQVVDESMAPSDRFEGADDPVLSTSYRGSTLSTYRTDDGTQTLIEIPSSSSPSEYRFPLTIPRGGEAVVIADGSVAIFDASGASLGGFHTPWAVDSAGGHVPSSFRLEGNTLVQSVDLKNVKNFPVIADPQRGTE